MKDIFVFSIRSILKLQKPWRCKTRWRRCTKNHSIL